MLVKQLVFASVGTAWRDEQSIFDKLVQLLKQLAPKLVICDGIIILVKDVQPAAKFLGIAVASVEAIISLVKLIHCSQNELPILVTFLGIIANSSDFELEH